MPWVRNVQKRQDWRQEDERRTMSSAYREPLFPAFCCWGLLSPLLEGCMLCFCPSGSAGVLRVAPGALVLDLWTPLGAQGPSSIPEKGPRGVDRWLQLPLSYDLFFLTAPSPNFFLPWDLSQASPELGEGPAVAVARPGGCTSWRPPPSSGRFVCIWGCFQELHKHSRWLLRQVCDSAEKEELWPLKPGRAGHMHQIRDDGRAEAW